MYTINISRNSLLPFQIPPPKKKEEHKKLPTVPNLQSCQCVLPEFIFETTGCIR